MNWKNVLKGFVSSVVGVATLYCGAVFVSLLPNPAAWTEAGRIAFICMVFAIHIVIVPIFWINDVD